ncbi:uncharacterized protein FYN12_014791 [Phoenicopterus ruber ruber]
METGRVLGAGAVLVALVVLGAHPAHGKETSGYFQQLSEYECHYLNGTEQVRYVHRHIYNRRQLAHFDSDVGYYVADTPLGEPDAKYWNSQPELLEQRRAAVDRFCRHNYGVATPFIVERRVQPKVRVFPMQSSSLPETNRLVCYVTGFYPVEIEVKWFKNGQEETERVVSTDVIQNGDWTYQVQVMLETTPQRGDTYMCQVEHVSLQHPITQHWELQSDAARSKMLTGVGGFVLGFIFLALGLFLYMRKKGASFPQLQVHVERLVGVERLQELPILLLPCLNPLLELSLVDRVPHCRGDGAARSGVSAPFQPLLGAAMETGRVLGAGAVLVALVVLGAHPARGEETSGYFQEMFKADCYFTNGTKHVRGVARYIYNRQQYVHFDSDVGHFVADTPRGEPSAEYWNSQPEILEQNRAAVDTVCRHNYRVYTPFTVERRVQPEVEIYPVQSSSLPETNRLVCYVTGFYPAEIEVKWFKNGQEETERVVSTDVIQNGDWTYQVLVMLETTPQRGDTYMCQVEHVSLQHPITQHWELQSDAARGKMLTGVGGFVLGLIFLALGLFLYMRKKGASFPRLQGS